MTVKIVIKLFHYLHSFETDLTADEWLNMSKKDKESVIRQAMFESDVEIEAHCNNSVIAAYD